MSVHRFIFAVFAIATIVGCKDAPSLMIPDGLWVQDGGGAAPRIAFVRDDEYGYLDAAGRVAIEPMYRWADDFRDGVALCSLNGQGTMIDESGSVIGTVPAHAATYFRADSDRVWYQVGEKWGLCNFQGEVLIQPLYEDVDAFSDSLARVNIGAKLRFPGFMEGGKTGYINRNGESVIACSFDELGWGFHNGYATVGDGLIDRNGVIQFSRVGIGYIFSDGVINVCSFKDDPTTDYVDATGMINFTVEGYGEEFAEGLAVVSDNKLAGFVDQSGAYVIQPRFEDAHSFSNGLAGVSVGMGRWGYIDRSGKLVTPTHFNEVRPAAKEFAIAHYGGTQQTADDGPVWWEGGRWLMIDRSGRPLAVIREDRSDDW
ncbi:WG repeat-containing protein [Stieleria varia]|nr:WG repeat-containing protein [Stieleria varia]